MAQLRGAQPSQIMPPHTWWGYICALHSPEAARSLKCSAFTRGTPPNSTTYPRSRLLSGEGRVRLRQAQVCRQHSGCCACTAAAPAVSECKCQLDRRRLSRVPDLVKLSSVPPWQHQLHPRAEAGGKGDFCDAREADSVPAAEHAVWE